MLFREPWRPESMFYRWDTTVSSLERLGEAGWLPDVRSEESLLYQACNQPAVVFAGLRMSLRWVTHNPRIMGPIACPLSPAWMYE